MKILVGPIASGKSTYCEEAAKNEAIIVNDDAIVTMLHGGFYNLYSHDLKPLYKAVENTIIQIAIILNKVIIIDRPNYSKKMRRRYIGLAHSLDVKVVCIIFRDEGAEIHARRRFENDSRNRSYKVWLEAAHRQERLKEEPDLFEEQLHDIIFI